MTITFNVNKQLQGMNEVEKLLEKWHTLSPDEEDQFIKDSIAEFNKKSEGEREQFINDFNAGAEKACDEVIELIIYQ